MGSATITTMATKLDDDDESLVYETKEDKLERARLSAVAFGGRAAVEQFVRDVDDSNTRHKVRRAPTPRELLVSENDILPYATSLFKGRRGADVAPASLPRRHESSCVARPAEVGVPTPVRTDRTVHAAAKVIRNLVFITEEAERAAIRREVRAATRETHRCASGSGLAPKKIVTRCESKSPWTQALAARQFETLATYVAPGRDPRGCDSEDPAVGGGHRGRRTRE
ncbi:hypothetical protein M885DRAFT_244825 [Pelagophyceae sp. CCMP2097]|nr:hypothetical protein M885DRAFT_244825 [Pelagophyceae sp. CCMP2097]